MAGQILREAEGALSIKDGSQGVAESKDSSRKTILRVG